MLRLTSGGAVLDLLPEIGGAVGRYAIDGVDILRPAPHGAVAALETSSFPLVPFANRIAFGTFASAGRTVHLPKNFGDHPHTLHGQGWQSPWHAASAGIDRAVLVYDHAEDSWPWDFRAEQAFRLDPQGLTVELRIANRARDAMPVSAGFHPYFPKSDRTEIKTGVAGVWLADEDCLPTERGAADRFGNLEQGVRLCAAPFIDHCFFGWDGRAAIRQEGYTVELTASPNLDHLHIYNPSALAAFCAEPVSAMPDAFNHPNSATIAVLAPGDSFVAAMRLKIEPW